MVCTNQPRVVNENRLYGECSLELRPQLRNATLRGTLQIHQLHGEAHVALYLDLALEEGLLRRQLARQQLEHIFVAYDESNIAFFCNKNN